LYENNQHSRQSKEPPLKLSPLPLTAMYHQLSIACRILNMWELGMRKKLENRLNRENWKKKTKNTEPKKKTD